MYKYGIRYFGDATFCGKGSHTSHSNPLAMSGFGCTPQEIAIFNPKCGKRTTVLNFERITGT